MGRKKCRECDGEGRIHVDPCPFGPNSKVLAGPFDCDCGRPACAACLGTGERQRHIRKSEEDILAIPGVREATEEDLEKANPGHLTRMAEEIAQDFDRQIVEELNAKLYHCDCIVCGRPMEVAGPVDAYMCDPCASKTRARMRGDKAEPS